MRTEPAFQTDAIYRANFEAQLLALHPASVLDVGCGTGDLMHRLAALGIRAAGIDPNAERVAALRDAGFDVQIGSGEALPFADQSFDVVVAQYVPHHCADWPAALAQMLRVAQRAVLVLEQWYDPSLLSQRVAAAYDAWCKAIDRAAGMGCITSRPPPRSFAPGQPAQPACVCRWPGGCGRTTNRWRSTRTTPRAKLRRPLTRPRRERGGSAFAPMRKCMGCRVKGRCV
jgi:SAM-dependent methyltransferase